MTTVILKDYPEGRKSHHPLAVNGHVRKLPVGEKVELDDSELEVLQRSEVEFDIVTDEAPAEEPAPVEEQAPEETGGQAGQSGEEGPAGEGESPQA